MVFNHQGTKRGTKHLLNFLHNSFAAGSDAVALWKTFVACHIVLFCFILYAGFDTYIATVYAHHAHRR
jgi:hypothetical protein